ncbi:MAG: histidine kinase N-terminal domain-containing protein [Actinomycetota bacterium]|nr:histidine kinase N-terminal domain-containing protein [Actinomycetota bacterium]
MASPAELALERTDLDDAQLSHLRRLVGTWGILADLSFSDLVLLAPMAATDPEQRGGGPMLVILGQMRPSNSATVVQHDLVGQTVGAADWPLVTATYQSGEVSRGELQLEAGEEPVRVQCIPVRFEGQMVAVLARLAAQAGRRPGHLERTYRDVFDRFAVMLAESAFPFPTEELATEEAPRVGDGLVLVDEEARVRYASPNATNALHRMGMYSQLEGHRLSDLGVEESAIEWALASALPVVEEVERRPDVIVLLHCVPILAQGSVTGCLVLLRDVTDVRRLDRLLLSKDAAIREVHHRVKNNLQTISALLRLQARRLPPGVGRVALSEAERRVRSIAVVHEILSRDPSDQVPFDEIVASLIRMAEDSVVSSRPVTFSVLGELGAVPADIATPLAVVLAELLQNAVEHAFIEFAAADDEPAAPLEIVQRNGGTAYASVGHIAVRLCHGEESLTVEVADDGAGLPAGFDIDATSSLGLSIVRDLVRSQLGGTIEMRNGRLGGDAESVGDPGTVVTLDLPVRPVANGRI